MNKKPSTGTSSAASGADQVAGFRDRINELVRVRAGDLVPNPRNWRRHPAEQRAALRGILRDIGYADALLARRDGADLVLIDGHLRQSLDPEQMVPVLVLDVDEREADLILATLDPLVGLATAEGPALQALLGRVETSSAAVRSLLEEVARRSRLPVTRLLIDPNYVPEQPEPRTQMGDLWRLGQHFLLCGDATRAQDVARLMQGVAADVLWTDPPYGVDYVGKTPERLRVRGDQAKDIAGLLEGALSAAAETLVPGAAIYLCHPAGVQSLTFLHAFVARGWRLHRGLVWVKNSMVLGHGDYHYRHEPIAFGYAPGGGRRGRGHSGWFGGNDQDSVLEYERPAASRQHPTMKPVELIRRCLGNSCPVGGVVLDPFCGAGSTLIACEMQGARARAIEIDPRYCDVIVKRYEELTGTVATLERQT